MSYEPTNWKSGDTVTSAKLNKIEQGIANAEGGGGVLIVHDVERTLDKTWQEIHDAAPTVFCTQNNEDYFPLASVFADSLSYVVDFIGYNFDGTIEFKEFRADSADGYPVMEQ